MPKRKIKAGDMVKVLTPDLSGVMCEAIAGDTEVNGWIWVYLDRLGEWVLESAIRVWGVQ